MLLTVDIGNSRISAGVFDAGDMRAVFSLSTVLGRTFDEYGILLKETCVSAGIGPGMIKAAIACSVVPSLVPVMRAAVNRYIGVEPVFVCDDVALPVKALVDAPLEVGADRLVNALAAHSRWNCALIVVDIGTACTFDLVSVDGSFAGGAIAPGPGLAAKALFENTAKLPLVDVVKTDHVIGKNTSSAMRSGVFWGFAAMVDGMIERMAKEGYPTGQRPMTVATGGFAGLFAPVCRRIDEADEYLTLKGLQMIHDDLPFLKER
ncbi:MAG: type III pantothenate kinase [Deltaproteobacteria bacterium]|nr:type III pantothenate kinase [Deltaproteobacteria bacterium]